MSGASPEPHMSRSVGIAAAGFPSLILTRVLILRRAPCYQSRDEYRQNHTHEPYIPVWGSGLAPDISPAATDFQIPRLAKARGMNSDDLRRIVALTQCAVREANFPEEAFWG